MKSKTRSPIKDKPLQYVAQSGDEAIDDLLNDRILYYYAIACGCGMTVIFEWLRYYSPLKQPPVISSIIFGVIFAFYGLKMVQHFRKLKNLKLGRNGERAVGQYLELFRESGCHVFHDIVGNSFNVDHVVISDKGIYVIETKTYSKPASGQATINFDGQQILVNGTVTYKDIPVQVKAATSYIKKILDDSTGRKYDPFPVVLFPGWYIQGNGNSLGKMWVLELKAFRKFLDRQTVKLSQDDVKLASYHLSRHIRTS